MSAATPTLPSRNAPAGEPAWELAYLYPRQGSWSEEEYLALALHRNRLLELIDGYFEVLPMPSILHQLIVDFLHSALKQFVKSKSLGTVVFSPMPVWLWPGTYREPDIVFLRPEHMKNPRGYAEGAELVMEVVSDTSEARERDLIAKRKDYAKAGIREYWIVDPEQERITVLTLDGDAYREHGVFAKGTTATSALLPGFTVQGDAVFSQS